MSRTILINHMNIGLYLEYSNYRSIEFYAKKISLFDKDNIIDYIIKNYSPLYNYEITINYICNKDLFCIVSFYNKEGEYISYYIFEQEQQLYPCSNIVDKKIMARELKINELLK